MPSIAPLAAGWQLRLGGQAGPLGPVSAGSGESPVGRLEVELFVDGQWQVITPYVMTRDGSYHVSVTAGTPNEGSKPVPASCTLQLNNRDGRFSPKNPLSPLYGKISRNQPLRVSVPSGNDKAYRFWGEVSAWPQNWDVTGTDVWVDLAASGILRRLGQGNSPIGSAMYVSLATAVPNNTVVAYWPCEDASGATAIGSAISGVRAMTINGVPTLATNSDFVCSGPLPTMGTASFTGQIPAYTPVGGPLNIGPNPFVTMLRFLLEIPGGGATDGQVVAGFTWNGSIPHWEIYYAAASSGKLGLRGRDSTGAIVQDTGTGGPALNGTKAHVTASFDESGGILFEFGLSILTVGSTSPSGPTGNAFGPTAGIVQSVTVAPGQGLSGTVIGHVSVQMSPSYPTDAADLALVVAAYAGEAAADRIARLCALVGVAYEQIGSSSGTVAMGTQLSATVLSLITQAVDADGGILYERTDALGLGYRTRVSMENQAPGLALSYPAFNLSAVPVPVDDDRYTRNDITVSRTGGSSGARATQTIGPLSVLQPPSGVGQYDQSTTLNIQADSSLADQAGWRLHLGTVDEARYPQLSINMAHPSFTGSTTLKAAVLALRPGDRITVSGMPTWTSPDGVSQLLLGTTETIDNFQHRLTFNLQPESPYRVAVTDDPVFGRVDTDGSALAADLGPADTTLSVTTTAGPAWTTNPADYPFDLTIGGERVTAYAIGQALGTADGSFESGVTGWNTSSCTFMQSADFAYRGAFSGLLTVTGSPSQAYVRPDSAHDAPVTVGQSYRCSLWVYSPAGYSSVVAAIDWADGAHGYLSTSTGTTQAVPAGVWTLLTVTATAPASAAFADYGPTIGASPPTGTALYVDDAVLVAATSYTSSPQQMTVLRSVNGVVKPQAAGADVRLTQPSIIAL